MKEKEYNSTRNRLVKGSSPSGPSIFLKDQNHEMQGFSTPTLSMGPRRVSAALSSRESNFQPRLFR